MLAWEIFRRKDVRIRYWGLAPPLGSPPAAPVPPVGPGGGGGRQTSLHTLLLTLQLCSLECHLKPGFNLSVLHLGVTGRMSVSWGLWGTLGLTYAEQEGSEAGFSKLVNHPGILGKCRSQGSRSEVGLRVCISHRLPGKVMLWVMDPL